MRKKPLYRASGLGGLCGLLALTLATPAHAVSCDFKNGDHFREICGYFAVGSNHIGGQLRAHVSSTTSNFAVHIRRAGHNNPVLHTAHFSGAVNHNGGNHINLNWGSAFTIPIPAGWTSGIYEVSFNNGRGDYSEFVAIRSPRPGTHSKILVLDSLPTKIAYSPIGGKSMYGFNSSEGRASPEVSLERPTGRGQWAEHREFVTWLDKQGIAYEAASMLDIHSDPSLLNQYDLVILVGHNEYWSKEMRDNWDRYLANGGNAAIFSGNTMWWQVRFSEDGKRMICYKNAATDPLYGRDNSRVTANWFAAPVHRPENTSIGVSFRHGGYHNYTENGTQYYVKHAYNDDGSHGGFRVTDAAHWVFAGTGLSNNSIFGRENSIVGYEVDGALFRMVNGKPVVTGEDGTPSNFQILAIAPAFAVNSPSGTPGVVHNNHNGQGWGTMGIFKPSATSGTVFVAPTIDWAEGLGKDSKVDTITRNVITRLQYRNTASTGTPLVTTNNSPNPPPQSGTSLNTTSSASSTTIAGNNNPTPQSVIQIQSNGGGSLPLAALLLGLVAIFRAQKSRK